MSKAGITATLDVELIQMIEKEALKKEMKVSALLNRILCPIDFWAGGK